MAAASASDAPPNFQTSSGARALLGDARRRTRRDAPSTAARRSTAVDRPPHRVVVVGQLDRRVGVRGGDAGERRVWYATLKSVNFRPLAVEITTTRSSVAISPRATSFSSAASATPVCGQLNSPVQVGARRRVGQLALGGLLDDAVVPLQRADRLADRHRVADLDRRRQRRLRRDRLELPSCSGTRDRAGWPPRPARRRCAGACVMRPSSSIMSKPGAERADVARGCRPG